MFPTFDALAISPKSLTAAMVLILLSSGTASADFLSDMKNRLFGPESYDECILTNMANVNNETAALAIKESCARQFPDGAPIKIAGNVYTLDRRGDPIPGVGAIVRLLSASARETVMEILNDMGDQLAGLSAEKLATLEARELEVLIHKAESLTHDQTTFTNKKSKLEDHLKTLKDRLRGFDETSQKHSEELIREKTALNEKRTPLLEKRKTEQEKLKDKTDGAKTASEKQRLHIENQLRQVQDEIGRARADGEAELERLNRSLGPGLSKTSTDLTTAAKALKKAEQELDNRETEYVQSLTKDYVKKKIRTISNYQSKYNVTKEMCGRVENRGKLVMLNADLVVYYKGEQVFPGRFNLEDIFRLTFYSFRSDNEFTKSGRVQFTHTNNYKEKVPGLRPNTSWRFNSIGGCINFSKHTLETGNYLRALEQIGGRKGIDWSAFKIFVIGATLARADSLKSHNTGNQKKWSYTETTPREVFAGELKVARKKFKELTAVKTAKQSHRRASDVNMTKKAALVSAKSAARKKTSDRLAKLRKTEAGLKAKLAGHEFIPPTSPALLAAEEALKPINLEISRIDQALSGIDADRKRQAHEIKAIQSQIDTFQKRLKQIDAEQDKVLSTIKISNSKKESSIKL